MFLFAALFVAALIFGYAMWRIQLLLEKQKLPPLPVHQRKTLHTPPAIEEIIEQAG